MRSHLLIVHADATTTLALKRGLEQALGVDVLGASGPEAALERITSDDKLLAVLLAWELPRLGALRLAMRVGERGGGPRMIAFSARWTDDDLKRAAQLGMAAILPAPLDADRVAEALRKPLGLAEARARLGAALYQPDPALWHIETSEMWRRRMLRLAEAAHTRWRSSAESRLRALRQRLQSVAGGPLGVPTLKALAASVEHGEERVRALGEAWQVDPRLLLRLLRRARAFAEATGGVGDLADLVGGLLADARRRAERAGDRLAQLQRAARASLRGRRAPQGDPLQLAAAGLLGVDAAVFDLPARDTQRLAARLLLEEDEASALEELRFALLARLLSVDEGLVSPAHVAALAKVFDPEKGIGADALLDWLAELNPPPRLQRLRLRGLVPYARALRGDDHRAALRGVVAQLVSATRALGPLDARRLSALADAVDGRASVLVGRTTLRSLERALGDSAASGVQEPAARLLFAFGARGSADAPPLRDTVRTLLDRRAACDLGRLLVLGRETLAQPTDTGPLTHLTDEELSASVDMAAGDADGVDFERAQVDDVLRAFGVDPRGVPDARLPPAEVGVEGLRNGEVARLRALAAVLSATRDEEEREALLGRHLGGRADHRVALTRMCGALEDRPTVELLRRVNRGPRGTVQTLLDTGRLDAAYDAAFDLDDADPTTAAQLNAVALAFFEAGRLAECPALYRRALRLKPDAVNLWFNRARIQHARGDLDDALRCVRAVLDRLPHFTPGRTLFSQLEARLYEDAPTPPGVLS